MASEENSGAKVQASAAIPLGHSQPLSSLGHLRPFLPHSVLNNGTFRTAQFFQSVAEEIEEDLGCSQSLE